MDSLWFTSATWIALALLSALIGMRVGIAVALIEITVGAVFGNLFTLASPEWVGYLATLGSMLLIFLAGAEIDPGIFRSHFRASVGIGFLSFLVPYLGCMLGAHYWFGWTWPQSQIAGLAMSTTSVAVIYAMVVESGLNRIAFGQIILAACFLTDFSTVAVLGGSFIELNLWLGVFVAATGLAIWLMPKFVPWFFARYGGRMSEPEIKLLLLVLFLLGGLAVAARSEPILPAFLLGVALARYFKTHPAVIHRLRSAAFALVTPFFFLRAGSMIDGNAVLASAGLIAAFLTLKTAFKFGGIVSVMMPLGYSRRDIMFTGLVMSSGLTFGSIAALFGLTNGIIDREQYTVLVSAVIASGVVPTMIAQKWFQPKLAAP